MSAVLRPTFYVVQFCTVFTSFTFNFLLLGPSLSAALVNVVVSMYC